MLNGGIAQLARASALHAEGRGFESLYLHNESYIGRISTVERELGSHRIATFTESANAPSCYVMDPALWCTQNR